MQDSAYARWAHGLCCCCGGELVEWIDGTEPQAIGEMVMICGRCVAMDHLEPPRLIEAMLLAIAVQHDGPIDAAIASAAPTPY